MRKTRRFAWPSILLLVLSSWSSAQSAPPTSKDREPGSLEGTLNDLTNKIPEWKALLSGIKVEALPISYKDGKGIEYLRTSSLEQLGTIEKLAASVHRTPTSAESVQLLLNLEDLYGGVFDHLATALLFVTDADGKTIKQAVEWGDLLNKADLSMLETEKRIEASVMMMLMARDALIDNCRDKLAH